MNIWRDPWIPSSPDRKILTPKGECILNHVSELIDPSIGVWDQELIQSNFHPIDAARILEIPVNLDAFEDFLGWQGNRTGRFSVRSAYHIEWRHQFNGVTCRSLIQGTSLNNPIWKILWKLKAPAKVKIFCWRVMHGTLPLKNILFSRHIGTSGTCLVCNLELEDIIHMVFKCPEAMIIWRGLGLENVINNEIRDDRSGSVVLQEILKSTPTSVPGYERIRIHDTVAVAAWYIWWLRRRRTHGESVPPVKRCVASILVIAANSAASQ